MAISSGCLLASAIPLLNLFYIFISLIAPSPTAAFTPLNPSTLRSLPRPGPSFSIDAPSSLLSPILIPRVSGTEGNEKVRSYFSTYFSTHLSKWTVTYQNSTSKTPATGNREIPFANFIAKRAPPWADEGETSYLTLVAHFDSKFTPEGFIGATDSAAPCAMILHAATTLDDALTKKWAAMSTSNADMTDGSDPDANRGVQVLLLDGEEAFKSWTKTDSIYGARSLAAEWEITPHAALSTYKNPLDAIEMFVLLDLLGAKNPLVPSYFLTSHWAYQAMADTEKRLREEGLFRSSPNSHQKRSGGDGKSEKKRQEEEPTWFWQRDKKDTDRWDGGLIGDDHEPFLARGVEILHVIPSPFPRVWHTPDDDGSHLDMDTTEDWAVLVTAFAAEWMDLEGYLEGGQEKTEKRDASGTASSDTAQHKVPGVSIRDEL